MRGFYAFKRQQATPPPGSDVLEFGTASSCDVRMHDRYASPHHCRAWRTPEGVYWIADLGSTNGTYIVKPFGTSLRVTTPSRVEPGDSVMIGRTVLPWTTKKGT